MFASNSFLKAVAEYEFKVRNCVMWFLMFGTSVNQIKFSATIPPHIASPIYIYVTFKDLVWERALQHTYLL